MPRKKTMSKTKKNTMKTKTKAVTEYETKDIDEMLEDLKNLALEKPEDKKESDSIVAAAEDVKDDEIVNYLNESKDNIVTSTEENAILTNKEDEINAIANSGIKEENQNDAIEETEIGNIDNETGPKEPIILNSEEDFDKLYREEEKLIEESKKENKVKRKTYEEMFGNTWMGYGYSTN